MLAHEPYSRFEAAEGTCRHEC